MFRLPIFFVLLAALYGCDSAVTLTTTDTADPDSPGTAVPPVIGAANGDVSEVGEWGPVMDWPHVAVSMANLPDGRILTYSGSERRTWPTTEQTYSATWNPQNGEFIENLHRGHNMFCAAMSMTSDGKVLVNGGRNQGNSPWTTLFDYQDNQWQQVQNMATGGRWYPTTLALGDGKVMTALGVATNTRNPDLWDPDEGWKVLNGIDFINMRQRNNEQGRDSSFPLLSLAPSGNVYHYWDTTENHLISTAGNGESRRANPTTDGVNHAGGIQLMYDVGKLLISGRNDGSWGGNATGAENNAFTVDLNGAVPDIRATASMFHKRKFHQLIPLPTGEVLVIGGNTTGAKFRDSGSVLEPEIWNPQTGTWRRVANMAVPRDYHSTALLMTDGRVLTAGGGYDAGNPNSSGTHQDAQIYSPDYLFQGTRPTISSSQGIADTGTSIDVTTSGNIDYFSFIRMSATTHSTNTDARFYKPQFQANGNNQYKVDIHQNPNVATPGYWMLFAVDSNGVPSVAQVIRVTALDTRLDNLAPAGIATQSSSVSNDATASKAIDQNLNGHADSNSLSQTNSEAQAYWQLDLGRTVQIDTIRLWNRTDCCSDQLSNYHVLVSPQPFVSTDLATTLSQPGVTDMHNQGTAGVQTDVTVDSVGRYVRIQLTGTGSLQLAEVQVFGSPRTDLSNVALNGSATQSSNYSSNALAANAIDDNTSGNAGSVSETVGGNGGGAFLLECPAGHVLAGMYGSTGTYVNSVGPRCVEVDASGNWIGQPQNRNRTGSTSGSSYTTTCPSGQAVSGFNSRADTYVNQITLQCRDLTSAQQMNGSVTTLNRTGNNTGTVRGTLDCNNGAATGLVGRSGSWLDSFGLQCSASSNQAITHTNADLNSWWELDIGRVVDIDSVMLWNRTDCCSERLSDFYILASETPFNSQDLATTNAQNGVVSRYIQGAAGESEEIPLGTTARYLRVQLSAANNFLSLAEVQVMAAEVAAPLEVQPLSQTPIQNGSEVSITASASGSGELQYKWNFGDGSTDTAYSTNSTGSHTYTNPGRYIVSLTVRDASGDEVRQTYTQIIHQPILATSPKASASVFEHSSRPQLWNVNPDNNTVSVIDTDTLALLAEIPVGVNPVSLAESANGDVWVVNRGSASIDIIDSQSLSVNSSIALANATQPYGIVFSANSAYIALEAVGQVVELSGTGVVTNTINVGTSPRHLSLTGNGQQLYVSRFISPPLPGEDTANPVINDGTRKYGGEIVVLNTATLSIADTIVLEHSNRIASEHEGPGIPNYLGALAISPAGDQAWIPSKQDNILAGGARGGNGITFDQSVRAITSRVDLGSNTEILPQRIDHDNASIASNTVYDPFGVTLFTSLEGNRQISIIDVNTAIEIGRFDTGRAPQGMAISADGKRLYVHNFMDRSVGVYNVEDIVNNGSTTSTELATVNVVSAELMDATVLRGKQLFYDARDDRLAALDYMSCASCHADGEHDGRVWDFTSLGEGLRNTITLSGRAGMGHGILHWTGNFDELQDFEGQIRSFAGGSGLMNNSDFVNTADPLGSSKTGLSNDLDALAAYMTSLDRVPDSPWRNTDGSLTTAALNGQSVFTTKGCGSCHSDAVFTDSTSALLHDIGTIMIDSGNRLDAPLTGLDTPSLLGVWRTAPYLHDGSAATLQDAIAAHININTTVAEQNQLAEFLLQLDDSTSSLPPVINPPTPPNTPPGNPVTDGTIVINGNLNDWTGLNSFGGDADDAANGNPIDWREAWMAHDSSNFYLGYLNDENIVPSWGWGIYIDVDANTATGFTGFSAELPTGADYLLEGGDLQQYTGTGNDWAWQSVGTMQYQFSGNSAEVVIPRALLGNATTLRLYFRGDNGALNGTTIDHYPDAVTDLSAAANERYFVYSTITGNGNTPPDASAQNVATSQGQSIDITLSGSDIDADTLNYEIADQPGNGTLSGTPPSVRYTPDQGFAGADSFSFAVSDNNATSTAATVSITVNAPPPPLGETNGIIVDGNLIEWPQTASFGIDPLDANGLNDSIDFTSGWTAYDGQNVYIAYQNETAINLSWGYGVYIDHDSNSSTGFRGSVGEYPLGADFLIEGSQLLQYTGTGANWSWASVATLDSGVLGNTAELAIPRSVFGATTQLQLFFTGQNAAVNGQSTDYYPDTVLVASSPTRFFTLTLDGQATNALPVAKGQAGVTELNTPLDIALQGSDPEGQTLSFQITRQPANGTLSGTAPNVTYTPNNNFSGVDTFDFRVSDGSDNSDPAVVSIFVGTNNGTFSNPVTAITLDGSIDDWSNLTAFTADPDDIIATAEHIDWRQAWMAHSADTLYVAIQNDAPVSALTYGHALYIDNDSSTSSGYRGFSADFAIGADFLLEGTDLYRYTGAGNNWMWSYVATVQTATVGGIVEYAIPRSLINNSAGIDIFWRGDNGAITSNSSTGVDFYPDAVTDSNAAAISRRFRYSM